MRGLCLVAFLCVVLPVSAQQKEVTITGGGVSSNVSRKDLEDPLTKKALSKKDSLLALKNTRALDSVNTIINTIKNQKVYSENQWKKLYDSLVKLPGINQPEIPTLPSKEVNEKQLVDAVNQKFFTQKDSIESGWKNLPNVPDSQKLGKPESDLSLPSDLTSQTDLSKLKLPAESKLTLPQLPTSITDSKYLNDLDSVRKLKLKAEGLDLNETKVDAEEKIASFKPKPPFWERAYFEGVIGFATGEHTIVQVSPTLGYHFTDYLSLGLGPNLLIKESDKSINATVGLKAFFKAEFLKRQGYFQAEDIMDSYGISDQEGNSKSFYEQHNIFLGGGWLLSINAPVTLNLSVLYCVTNSSAVKNEFSPFVFRIGISTVKRKK